MIQEVPELAEHHLAQAKRVW